VEDSWKVEPNLTLNLGVRYDIQLIPAPPKPNTATPLTTLYTSTINIDKNNFAPRIGVAWAMPIFVDSNSRAVHHHAQLRYHQRIGINPEHCHRAILYFPCRSYRSDPDWLQRCELLV
jgi:hypothetical protein